MFVSLALQIRAMLLWSNTSDRQTTTNTHTQKNKHKNTFVFLDSSHNVTLAITN